LPTLGYGIRGAPTGRIPLVLTQTGKIYRVISDYLTCTTTW